jgi:hypothetical protein
MALFPEDRAEEISDEQVVGMRLKDLKLSRPRQWGACWLASHLYQELELDKFWSQRLRQFLAPLGGDTPVGNGCGMP